MLMLLYASNVLTNAINNCRFPYLTAMVPPPHLVQASMLVLGLRTPHFGASQRPPTHLNATTALKAGFARWGKPWQAVREREARLGALAAHQSSLLELGIGTKSMEAAAARERFAHLTGTTGIQGTLARIARYSRDQCWRDREGVRKQLRKSLRRC